MKAGKDSKGTTMYKPLLQHGYVRCLFPDGSVQIVNRKNLSEVKS